jgi:hypothetical protein
MMQVKKLYPGGKEKAFNITYDDGVEQDVPFITMLNRYGIKGTFNLNSELMRTEFSWRHPSGADIKRLGVDAVRHLYDGHEVASHSLTHPYMRELTDEELRRQMGEDKRNLEQLFCREVAGFALPFRYYDQRIADCAKACGFEYSRMSEFSLTYAPCTDWYYWKTGVYHIMPELKSFVQGFLETDRELAVCQIVGHSYDLDTENLWQTMEDICDAVSRRDEIWKCTNLELVRYLRAMEQVEISEDSIHNHSNIPLWFWIDGKKVVINPAEKH